MLDFDLFEDLGPRFPLLIFSFFNWKGADDTSGNKFNIYILKFSIDRINNK